MFANGRRAWDAVDVDRVTSHTDNHSEPRQGADVMRDEIQDYRDKGLWIEALEALQRAADQAWADGAGLFRQRCPQWYRHVFGRRCLLLDAARGAGGEALPKIENLLNPQNALRFLIDNSLPPEAADLSNGYRNLLDCRLKLIRASAGQDIQGNLRNAIEGYAGCWNYAPNDAVSAMPPGGEPAFLARLPNDGWRDAFRELANDEAIGMLHPGLHLAGETIAYLHSATRELPTGYDVQTWVVLVNKRHQEGVLGRLRLARVPGGCGALYPDPLAGGYRLTGADFQAGLKHAWLAVRQELLSQAPEQGPFDVRWWIDVPDPDDELPADAFITGRSAEFAFACGLKALALREQLDDFTAVTACFKDPAGGDFTASPVSSVRAKAGVGQLSEILVASGQQVAYEREAINVSENSESIRIGRRQVKLTPIRDLDEAYELLSRFPRMTRVACQRIADAEKSQLQEWCGEVDGEINYVLSSLSREMPPDQRRADHEGNVIDRQPLTDEQVAQVVHGQISDGEGVLLIADSGFGKTTLLTHCSREIARLADGRLPLRLDNLSGYDWRTPENLLSTLAKGWRRCRCQKNCMFCPALVQAPRRQGTSCVPARRA